MTKDILKFYQKRQQDVIAYSFGPAFARYYFGEFTDDKGTKCVALGNKQSTAVYIIPAIFNFIDLSRLARSNAWSPQLAEDIERVICNDDGYDADESTYINSVAGENDMYHGYAAPDGSIVYVASKLLKDFPKGFSVRAKNAMTGVKVYADGIYIGYVLPTRLSKGARKEG